MNAPRRAGKDVSWTRERSCRSPRSERSCARAKAELLVASEMEGVGTTSPGRRDESLRCHSARSLPGMVASFVRWCTLDFEDILRGQSSLKRRERAMSSRLGLDMLYHDCLRYEDYVLVARDTSDSVVCDGTTQQRYSARL